MSEKVMQANEVPGIYVEQVEREHERRPTPDEYHCPGHNPRCGENGQMRPR